MKRFSFRLERVLNLRRDREKQAQRDLYRAQNEYTLKEKAIGQMSMKRQEVDRMRRQQELHGIDVSLHQIYRSFLNRTDLQIDEALLISESLHD